MRPALWKWSEFTFNTLFLVELLVNFYGLAFVFWRHNCGWNCFDLLVVSIGCVGMAEAIGGAFMPPQLALVRNLRAFRIFRLFKRVKSLNKILSSCACSLAALPPPPSQPPVLPPLLPPSRYSRLSSRPTALFPAGPHLAPKTAPLHRCADSARRSPASSTHF